MPSPPPVDKTAFDGWYLPQPLPLALKSMTFHPSPVSTPVVLLFSNLTPIFFVLTRRAAQCRGRGHVDAGNAPAGKQPFLQVCCTLRSSILHALTIARTMLYSKFEIPPVSVCSQPGHVLYRYGWSHKADSAYLRSSLAPSQKSFTVLPVHHRYCVDHGLVQLSSVSEEAPSSISSCSLNLFHTIYGKWYSCFFERT